VMSCFRCSGHPCCCWHSSSCAALGFADSLSVLQQPAAMLRVAILSIYFTGVVRRVVRNTPNAALVLFSMVHAVLVLDRIRRVST
jgi:hypothetical protein